MERKYWQAIRGICILAVVLIHALGGFDYSTGYETEFIIIRQIINFGVAVFFFLSGYFVPTEKMLNRDFRYRTWIFKRVKRLCIPFILWSLFYSGISLVIEIHCGTTIDWSGYAYRFVIGKSATPFYYIVVLIQFTIITPCLVNVIEKNKKANKLLWLVTPCYLFYLYLWNFTKGSSPYLYETLFPAWFGFYYLGMQIRCGLKLKCNGYLVGSMWLISCLEALSLRKFGMSIGFCISQITVGSFLFSAVLIGWLLKYADKQVENIKWLTKIGDCSYGIFYVHMIVLMVIEKMIQSTNWYVGWCLRFGLTSMISFCIVLIGQKMFKSKKKILKYVGFV